MKNINRVLFTAICMALTFCSFAQSQTVRCNFDTNSTQISSEDKSELDELIEKLKTVSGDVEVICAGYADPTGTQNYNDELAVKRAKAIHEYISAATLPENVKTKALGQAVISWVDVTVDDNDTARRVDVWITPPLK